MTIKKQVAVPQTPDARRNDNETPAHQPAVDSAAIETIDLQTPDNNGKPATTIAIPKHIILQSDCDLLKRMLTSSFREGRNSQLMFPEVPAENLQFLAEHLRNPGMSLSDYTLNDLITLMELAQFFDYSSLKNHISWHMERLDDSLFESHFTSVATTGQDEKKRSWVQVMLEWAWQTQEPALQHHCFVLFRENGWTPVPTPEKDWAAPYLKTLPIVSARDLLFLKRKNVLDLVFAPGNNVRELWFNTIPYTTLADIQWQTLDLGRVEVVHLNSAQYLPEHFMRQLFRPGNTIKKLDLCFILPFVLSNVPWHALDLKQLETLELQHPVSASFLTQVFPDGNRIRTLSFSNTDFSVVADMNWNMVTTAPLETLSMDTIKDVPAALFLRLFAKGNTVTTAGFFNIDFAQTKEIDWNSLDLSNLKTLTLTGCKNIPPVFANAAAAQQAA